jgi:hypothetical protein
MRRLSFPLNLLLLATLLLVRPSEPCADPSPSPSRSPVQRAACEVPSLGDRLVHWPFWLMRWLAGHWWWLLLAALAVAAVVVAARAVRGWVWRREVAAGGFVQITPPRRLTVADSGRTWRLMTVLAARAGSGWWRPARPPLTFEIHARNGRLMIGMWRPARVSLSALADRVELAWPGATVTERPAPPVETQWHWSGMWLAPAEPETGPLVDEAHLRAHSNRAPEDDPLRSVLLALASSSGPAVLQVLVRTVPGRRLARLRRATRRPPRRHRNPGQRVAAVAAGLARAALLTLLDLFTPGPNLRDRPRRTRTDGRAAPAGLLESQAMRDAAAKLRSGPFLLAAIRVAAGATERHVAASVAQGAASAYVLASAALRPVRLPRAARAVELRTARRVEWVLYTVAELGVLAHLPADPAAYRIDTTARHRRHPAGIAQPGPERRIGDLPAWLPDGGWDNLHTPGNGRGEHLNTDAPPPVARPDPEPVDDDAFWFDTDESYRDDDDPEEN